MKTQNIVKYSRFQAIINKIRYSSVQRRKKVMKKVQDICTVVKDSITTVYNTVCDGVVSWFWRTTSATLIVVDEKIDRMAA